MKTTIAFLTIVLFSAVAICHAAPIADLGLTPLDNGFVTTASSSAWWTTSTALAGATYETSSTPPAGAFVCPAGFRCAINSFGWAVLQESSVVVTPGTGGLGLSGESAAVGVPELAILRRLPRHIYGPQLNAALTPTLQRITAWTAAKLLNAKSQGDFIYLPSVTLEVTGWCSGLIAMKWFALLGLLLAVTSGAAIPWRLALFVAAPLIAIEANILRVAMTGLGYEFGWGWTFKEALGWPMLGLGLAQVLSLGWWVNRRAH